MYDPVGNVTQANHNMVGANSQAYTYDALDRLASATGSSATKPSAAYNYTGEST